ncbi:MAG: aspartate aminotransferase family protein [Congregibacter sp.]
MKEPTDATGRAVDTLGMDVEEMRRLAYKVVDRVIDHLENRSAEPAISTADPATLLAALAGPLPEQPTDPDESLSLLCDVALRHQQHGDHPRYFARVPGPSSFGGILAEWLGVGFNGIAASWAGGSGPSSVELVVIEWLRQLMGLPEGTEGVLVSGGSQATLTALAAILSQRGKGVAYLSEQTHSCVQRALITLRFTVDDIRVLPTDTHFSLQPQTLQEAISQDRRRGKTPLVVIATAGTTNTGATDPLNALADICEQEKIWLHVDGAYGAPAALTDSGRSYLQGIHRADSLVIDPHKWLFQPYDTGCLLIRPGVLESAFTMDPEYLRDVTAASEEIDFRNRGLELSRRSRALKLWFSFRSYGITRFREAIQTSIDMAEFAEAQLSADTKTWEIVSPAQIGIVCFALRGHPAEEHRRRAQALSDSGFACVSTTILLGRTVLRLCTINPLTTQADITETLVRLATASMLPGDSSRG